MIKYLAFVLAGHNVQQYFYLSENMDRLELTEAFAMQRTSQYLALEEPKKARRQMPSDSNE